MKTISILVLATLTLAAHEGHGKKTAPASAQKLKSPLTAGQAKPELGKTAYEQSCAGCHGSDGKGKSAAAAAMKIKPTNLTDHRMDSMKDGEIYWVVTNGVAKTMPGFKDKLSETERWRIVNYVRSLRRQQAHH